MSAPPRCPRCENEDAEKLLPCSDVLVGYEERVAATHECAECHARFRHVPPPEPTITEPIGFPVVTKEDAAC